MANTNIKRTVLIHTLVFPPDGVSTSYLYGDIACGFIDEGFDVIVITTTPHYNPPDSISGYSFEKRFLGIYSTSFFNGAKVYHIPMKKFRSVFLRLVSFIYWHFFSFLIGLRCKKISYIISPSPPLTLGLVSLVLAKIKNAKSIYNVQEIYPDLLINKGYLDSPVLIGILKKLEKFIYNYSSSVVTIDDFFYKKLYHRFRDPTKLEIIPNFVDTDFYKPIKNFKLPNGFKDNNKIIVGYAGNIGYFQDWEPLLYAANLLKDANIEFWIIGEGVSTSYLHGELHSKELHNVILYPYQKQVDIVKIINRIDIHFISINKDLEQEGLPSKIYSIMACAKPLIVTAGKNTPINEFLSKYRCAIQITENYNSGFFDAIKRLYNDKSLRFELGKSAREIALNSYSRDKIISDYINLINRL